MSTSASSASKIAFVKTDLIIVRVCISTQKHNYSTIDNTETTIDISLTIVNIYLLMFILSF